MNKILPLAAYAFISLALQSTVHAELIKNSTHFKKYGEPDSFKWAPARYQSDFRYDIPYYIPARLKNTKQAKVMIFLHGGGSSTKTPQGCEDAINLLFPSVKYWADRLGVIAVLPSSNGLNWSSHTRGMLRDLATLIRTELDIDSNSIGVIGHSMGGMGITRSYQYGADEFAFFMPMSSAIDTKKPANWNDDFISKVFNVPYIQLQGTRDMFYTFVTRNKAHSERVEKLEEKYGMKSKFKLVLFPGTHEMTTGYENLAKEYLESLFKTPRNLYQKELFGTIYTGNITRSEYNIPVNIDSEPRYFWVELTQTDLTLPETTNFRASVKNQTIEITFSTLPIRSKNLRIYLSDKFIDLNQPITIQVNGRDVAVRGPKLSPEVNVDANDLAVRFNDFIDIPVAQLSPLTPATTAQASRN